MNGKTFFKNRLQIQFFKQKITCASCAQNWKKKFAICMQIPFEFTIYQFSNQECNFEWLHIFGWANRGNLQKKPPTNSFQVHFLKKNEWKLTRKDCKEITNDGTRDTKSMKRDTENWLNVNIWFKSVEFKNE